MTLDSAVHTYKDLIVWQRAMELVVAVYGLTRGFPDGERFGLTTQMRRAAVSIPSNIAEGRTRGTRNDYLQFLRTAFASGAELETQVEIAKRLSLKGASDCDQVDALLNEVMRMLHVMIKNMNPRAERVLKAIEASEAKEASEARTYG